MTASFSVSTTVSRDNGVEQVSLRRCTVAHSFYRIIGRLLPVAASQAAAGDRTSWSVRSPAGTHDRGLRARHQ